MAQQSLKTIMLVQRSRRAQVVPSTFPIQGRATTASRGSGTIISGDLSYLAPFKTHFFGENGADAHHICVCMYLPKRQVSPETPPLNEAVSEYEQKIHGALSPPPLT